MYTPKYRVNDQIIHITSNTVYKIVDLKGGAYFFEYDISGNKRQGNADCLMVDRMTKLYTLGNTINPGIDTSNNIQSSCTCTGHTLLHKGCTCGNTPKKQWGLRA